MGIIDKLFKKELEEPVQQEKAGKLYAVAISDEERRHFTTRRVTMQTLNEYKTIYEQGGIFTRAINRYADYILKDGYEFEGEDPALVKMVEDFAHSTNFERVIYESIIDALVFGDSYDEIIMNRSGTKILGVSGRQSQLFEPQYDDYNNILSYKQYLNDSNTYSLIEPHHIMHLRLNGMSGGTNGISLIGSAYDDVMRDVRIAEAAETAILRHGYPIWQVRVGTTGEMVPDDVLAALESKFEDINSANEIITQYDVEINQLNEGGIDGLSDNSEFSIERACAALGVPQEVLGLGSTSSTFATANVTMQSFLFVIHRMQKTIEYAYNKEVIDKVTGVPGAVKLKFNSTNMVNQDTSTEPKEIVEENIVEEA
jgi:hypothetical protein